MAWAFRIIILPTLCIFALLVAPVHAQSPALPGQSTTQAEPIDDSQALDFFSTNVNTAPAPPPEIDPNLYLQNQAAPSAESLEAEVRRDAFDTAIESLLPLRPEEIRELLERFDRTQESVELPVYPSPKPEVAVQTIPLDPGTKPAVIRVAHGHVTTLNILDNTGAPWPIEDISWAGNFEIIQSGAGNTGAHIVRITPQSEFAYGNMSIKLLTLQTPVILTMETSRDLVHYRFDAIIPENGPMATAPIIQGGLTLTAGSAEMSSILQGLAPPGAKRLNVSGVDTRTSAYKIGSQTYVRTPLTLLSPSWSSSVASADGMRVYTLRNAPVLLFSDGGQMVKARLTPREDISNDQ